LKFIKKWGENMKKVEFNQNSFGQQLIITGLARLVE
jgi:hypothetical protein